MASDREWLRRPVECNDCGPTEWVLDYSDDSRDYLLTCARCGSTYGRYALYHANAV